MGEGKLIIFDHYKDQVHNSVIEFLSQWGKRPWNDMNIPVGLSLYQDDIGNKKADIVVFHPRKECVKHVFVFILDKEELRQLQETFRGISELFNFAGTRLEAFSKDWIPSDGDEWGGNVLYYWEGEIVSI